jgi:hypothetical protein
MVNVGFFYVFNERTDKETPHMAKDSKDTWKPTRTHEGADIGGGKSHKSGYGLVGNDISAKIEAAQRKDAAGKGRC